MANFIGQYLRGLKVNDEHYRTMDAGKGAVETELIRLIHPRLYAGLYASPAIAAQLKLAIRFYEQKTLHK